MDTPNQDEPSSPSVAALQREARQSAGRLVRTLGKEPLTALVVGASGGLGAAVARALAEHPGVHLTTTARRTAPSPDALLDRVSVDLLAEQSLANLASHLTDRPPLRLLFVATGVLHDSNRGVTPEKKLEELDLAAMQRVFAINTFGPLLLLKHLKPLLPRRDRGVLAFLSARVGSIEDNRAGGWYSYRASKAALNQGLRCAAIELHRSHSELACAALHPGTVDTALSGPFQRGLPAGQLKQPDKAAAGLLQVLSQVTPTPSGTFLDWSGDTVPW